MICRRFEDSIGIRIKQVRATKVKITILNIKMRKNIIENNLGITIGNTICIIMPGTI